MRLPRNRFQSRYDPDRVVPDLINRFYKPVYRALIEKLYKAHRLVEGRAGQVFDAFHIAVLLVVVDDYMHKLYLPLVEGLVVDEGGEGLHDRVVIQLRDPPDQQAEGHFAVLSRIALLTAQLGGQDTFQCLIIPGGQRVVMRQLVDRQGAAMLVHIAIDLVAVVQITNAQDIRSLLGEGRYNIILLLSTDLSQPNGVF